MNYVTSLPSHLETGVCATSSWDMCCLQCIEIYVIITIALGVRAMMSWAAYLHHHRTWVQSVLSSCVSSSPSHLDCKLYCLELCVVITIALRVQAVLSCHHLIWSASYVSWAPFYRYHSQSEWWRWNKRC